MKREIIKYLKLVMYSKRNFFVVGFESGIKIEKEYTLSQILDNTDYTEVRYSLLDILDIIGKQKANHYG